MTNKIVNARRSHGFTLIELLFVISIIALLSSVILASLANAKKKAQDAAIKELAIQMRNVYEIEYSKNGSYAGLNTPNIPGSFGLGYSCANTINSTLMNCAIYYTIGCGNFYTNTEASKICKDIFNKGGMYNIGTNSSPAFNDNYAAFITYASNINLGACFGNYGKFIEKTNSANCFQSGVGL